MTAATPSPRPLHGVSLSVGHRLPGKSSFKTLLNTGQPKQTDRPLPMSAVMTASAYQSTSAILRLESCSSLATFCFRLDSGYVIYSYVIYSYVGMCSSARLLHTGSLSKELVNLGCAAAWYCFRSFPLAIVAGHNSSLSGMLQGSK